MTLSQEKDVHIVYKKLGETPLFALQEFVKENPKYLESSVTYAGRLDPMAEGILILLTNEKVKDKDSFLNLPKTYEFEVLWGFGTDTLDVLGKITNYKLQIIKEEEIKEYLIKSVGKFEQSYPAYSSKPVNGKPLFMWAREGKLSEIELPKHEVELYSGRLLHRKSILKKDLEKEIEEKISTVKGDFRQNEILEKWKDELINSTSEEFIVDKMELKVSSGFYVRQFVSDLAKNFSHSATTFHIKRTKIGDYDIADSFK